MPPQRCYEAVSSAAVKVPGSRLVVLTTSGEPGHWSRKVLDHALADPGLWRVNEVAGPSIGLIRNVSLVRNDGFRKAPGEDCS